MVQYKSYCLAASCIAALVVIESCRVNVDKYIVEKEMLAPRSAPSRGGFMTDNLKLS
jgi:hypothetical protein